MQFKIEHRVGAPTNSRAIWDVLSDLGRWPEWNSLYPEVKGLLRIQQKLTLREVFPAQPPRTIQPMVFDWVPNAQIIWVHAELGGLVKRIRYIEIESLNEDDANCILSNGEIWQGWLGPLMGKRKRRSLKAGFEQFNRDVLARLRAVEAGTAIADGDRG
jgi:hypothetical protein